MLWTLMVCKPQWFDIFDSFSLVQPIRLFEPFKQGISLAHCSVLNESIEHADNTVVCFGKKVCFENWKQCARNVTDSLL